MQTRSVSASTVAPAIQSRLVNTTETGQTLTPTTLENYTEAMSFFGGNPPEKTLLRLYFETLESGKLPTREIIERKVAGKVKSSKPINIDELMSVLNRSLNGFGYESIDFIPNKELANIYGAYTRIRERSSPGDVITIEQIATEAGANLAFITGVLSTKDFSRIARLDPKFGEIFNDLSVQALGHQIAILDTQDALSNAHKWQVDPDTLDSARALIKSSMQKGSLVSVCEVAGQYTFMLEDELGKLVEPGDNISDRETLSNVRRVKLSKLLHKLNEVDNINDTSLRIAWCYFRAKGNEPEANVRSLMAEIQAQSIENIDLVSLTNSLTSLEKSTDTDFSLDMFSQIGEITTERAPYASKEFDRFINLVLTNLVTSGRFTGVEITPAAITHILENVIGLTEKDYAVYKACQELCKNVKDQEKVVREEELVTSLETAGYGVEREQIGLSLETIQRVFDEEFILTRPNSETFVPMLKHLDQKARRALGYPTGSSDRLHIKDHTKRKK